MDNNEILEERRVVNKAQKLARAYHIDDSTAVMVVLAANLARIDQNLESLIGRDEEASFLRVWEAIDTYE